MNLRERADLTVKDVCAALGIEADEAGAERARKVVEKAIIDAVLGEQERCTQAAIDCCMPDRDRAHKVAAGIRQSREALIANLSSMR